MCEGAMVFKKDCRATNDDDDDEALCAGVH
jgi:hypothetical protein